MQAKEGSGRESVGFFNFQLLFNFICTCSFLRLGALIGVAPVNLPANFASMSVKELWGIYEEISKLLEAKMRAEKEVLEQRLITTARVGSVSPMRAGRS
jgi:hypothetical protein